MEKEIIKIEVEKSVKEKADEIFQKLGMTTEMAVKIFLNKVLIESGMPFNVRIDDKSKGDRNDREERRGGGRFGGGNRGGFGGRDRGDRGNRGDRGGFGGGRKSDRDNPHRDRGPKKEEYNLRGNLLDDSRRFSRKDNSARCGDSQPRRERDKITLNK